MTGNNINNTPDEFLLYTLLDRKVGCTDRYGNLPCELLQRVEEIAKSNEDFQKQITSNLELFSSEKIISHLVSKGYSRAVGKDDRQEYYEVGNDLKSLANNDVAIVCKKVLRYQLGNGDWVVNAISFTNRRFCSCEKFAGQIKAAQCSGFAFSKNLVMTAGHCYENYSCDGSNFLDAHKLVFGFHMMSNSIPQQWVIRKEDVYDIKEVVAFRNDKGFDYLILKTDRDIPNHRVARINTSYEPKINDPLVLVGHPYGIPTKIARNAFIKNVTQQDFLADMDAFPGNSGSAVYLKGTNEVLGIHVESLGPIAASTPNGCRMTCFLDESHRRVIRLSAIEKDLGINLTKLDNKMAKQMATSKLNSCPQGSDDKKDLKPYVHVTRNPMDRLTPIDSIYLGCLIPNSNRYKIVKEEPPAFQGSRLILRVKLWDSNPANPDMIFFCREIDRNLIAQTHGVWIKEIEVVVTTSQNPDEEGTVIVNYDDPDGDD